MRITSIHTGMVLLTFLVATSCNKEEGAWTGEGTFPDFSTVPIEINASVASSTKGQDPTGIVEIQNFGMSAIWNYDSSPVNRWMLTDQLVQKEVVDESTHTYNWIINPQAFWPLAGTLSFFFYTPFKDSQHPESNFIPSSSGMPGITFSPGQNATTQYDFCVAAPLHERTSAQGPLTVTFDHVLSRVYLYANYDGLLPPDTFVMIDSVRFENIYGTKNIWFKNDSTKYAWQDETGLTPDASYVISQKNGQIVVDSLVRRNVANDNHKGLYQSAGRLYLLPQNLSPSASLHVYYGFYIGDVHNPKRIGGFEKDVPFPSGSVWPMGKTVKLNLTLGVGLSSVCIINAEITDWTDSNNEMNGGNPIEYE